jgi:hypothetical protein
MIYNLPPLPELYGRIGFHDIYTADQMRAYAQAALDALAAPGVPSGEPDWRHPKIQALIGGKARREIELQLVDQLLDDPDCDLTSMDMEYWHGLHDKLRARLTAPQPAPAVRQCALWVVDAYNSQRPDYLLRSIQKLTRALDGAAPAAPGGAHG